MKLYKSLTALLNTLFVAGMINPLTATANPTSEDLAIPRYEHIFIIIEENHGYEQVIGNSNAPILNSLAKTYGQATDFYGEVHPSEANYIALLGGSTFGIHDDDAYYCKPGTSDRYCEGSSAPDYVDHTIYSRSLLNQLEHKGLTWKGYFENIPSPYVNYGNAIAPLESGVVYNPPDPTDIQPAELYGAKHNGFISFDHVQKDPNLAQKLVGFEQLTADLKSGNVPNYSHIVPNQCNEMHGLSGANVPLDCLGSNDQGRISRGDYEVGQIVAQIKSSSLWKSPGNNAIIITWDEDNNPAVKTGTQGCCGYDPASNANFGGGHIPTIVITNHQSSGVQDNTPYNHYSMLRTVEDAFGIYNYLNYAADTADGVKPMTSLFSTTAAKLPKGVEIAKKK